MKLRQTTGQIWFEEMSKTDSESRKRERKIDTDEIICSRYMLEKHWELYHPKTNMFDK